MADNAPRPGGGGMAEDAVAASAIRRCEERLAKDPTSLAFAPLADLYRKAGRNRDAIALCRDGLGRYPHYTTARLILAKAYLAEGNQEGALTELNQMVAQSPTDWTELLLFNAISTTESAELSFGDESMAAIKVSLGTRRDGANLALPSWRLRIPA